MIVEGKMLVRIYDSDDVVGGNGPDMVAVTVVVTALGLGIEDIAAVVADFPTCDEDAEVVRIFAGVALFDDRPWDCSSTAAGGGGIWIQLYWRLSTGMPYLAPSLNCPLKRSKQSRQTATISPFSRVMTPFLVLCCRRNGKSWKKDIIILRRNFRTVEKFGKRSNKKRHDDL